MAESTSLPCTLRNCLFWQHSLLTFLKKLGLLNFCFRTKTDSIPDAGFAIPSNITPQIYLNIKCLFSFPRFISRIISSMDNPWVEAEDYLQGSYWVCQYTDVHFHLIYVGSLQISAGLLIPLHSCFYMAFTNT